MGKNIMTVPRLHGTSTFCTAVQNWAEGGKNIMGIVTNKGDIGGNCPLYVSHLKGNKGDIYALNGGIVAQAVIGIVGELEKLSRNLGSMVCNNSLVIVSQVRSGIVRQSVRLPHNGPK